MTEENKPDEGATPEEGAKPAEPSTLSKAANPEVPQAIATAQAPKANPVVRGKVPTIPAGAPLYRVKPTAKAHFINGRVVQPGEEVRYAGVPGTGLEPLDKAAVAAMEAADKERAARKADAENKRSALAEVRRLEKRLKG